MTDWEHKIDFKLSRAAVTVLGGKFFEMYMNDYSEIEQHGPAFIEALDELCCTLETHIMGPKDFDWHSHLRGAEEALVRRTK